MSAVRAQSPHTLARADVPFAFQYGGHVFSAGTYTIGTTSEHVMFVRGNHDVRLGMITRNETGTLEGDGKLVFRRVGDQYALKEIWIPRLAEALICPVPKQPKRRELVQELRSASESTVTIAALETVR